MGNEKSISLDVHTRPKLMRSHIHLTLKIRLLNMEFGQSNPSSIIISYHYYYFPIIILSLRYYHYLISIAHKINEVINPIYALYDIRSERTSFNTKHSIHYMIQNLLLTNASKSFLQVDHFFDVLWRLAKTTQQ